MTAGREQDAREAAARLFDRAEWARGYADTAALHAVNVRDLVIIEAALLPSPPATDGEASAGGER